ncbi:response regulator [Kocuria oceani]|uniref:Response regulator n=1 Tax=Kocuria oceani TaxID=988827 RepID=A0ABV9TLY0_9MICC|nr:response regulator transcription factor [Kocuria oceani]
MAQLTDPIRVLIADDESLMRAGLRLILDGAPGIVVVGEAVDGADAVGQAHRLVPDLVLTDIRMPGCDGIEATRRLRAGARPPRVLVLTAFDTDDFVLDALEAGADGFLLKDTPPDELVAALRQAAAGTMTISPTVLRRLVTVATRHGRRTTTPDLLAGLSDREHEVAERVAQGLSNTQIAQDLYLSVPTVKTHIGRIFTKLGIDNRVQLAIKFLESRQQTTSR